MIHSEKSWDLNFTNRFPKMWELLQFKKTEVYKNRICRIPV
ncbi:hypothetical protein LEP1GSC021_1400 [Leptospira noguchii str. 1993005606]|uniref:Uncharacterized protein n=1 Tax=Leptospira noguchii str. 2007001578 TaxID=1049974 RepID=A0ABP2T426_9LEPT|nr:hypothetical protein LEP1GSC035_3444 [Leptospira noguchii str. 2007001578]EPE86503.1 hypothetical protein LEP1GSC021_1400 [Leptospira noguchii str. 1993005606]